jgi:hypothetical protein
MRLHISFRLTGGCPHTFGGLHIVVYSGIRCVHLDSILTDPCRGGVCMCSALAVMVQIDI